MFIFVCIIVIIFSANMVFATYLAEKATEEFIKQIKGTDAGPQHIDVIYKHYGDWLFIKHWFYECPEFNNKRGK